MFRENPVGTMGPLDIGSLERDLDIGEVHIFEDLHVVIDLLGGFGTVLRDLGTGPGLGEPIEDLHA